MAHRQLGLQGVQRQVMQLDASSRHKKFVNGASPPAPPHPTSSGRPPTSDRAAAATRADYVIHYGGQRPEGWRPPVQGVTDADILRQNHRFIRSEADDAVSTWERRLAKKYYDKCDRPPPAPARVTVTPPP